MNTKPRIELSEKQLNTLYTCLESGLSRRLAANAMALLEEDLQRWIDDHPLREAILGTAEAKFHVRCIDALLSPVTGKNSAQVRAIMWLLESRFPDQYGKKKAAKPTKQPVQEPPVPAATSTPAPAPAAKCTNIVELPPEPSQNPHAEIRNHLNPGRNERCSCASGLKYKHCCGAVNAAMRRTGVKTAQCSEELAAAA